jgi:UDP-N-acetylmuramyl tripeptide synthase
LQAQQQFEDRQQQALGYVDQARAREAQARLGLGGQMMSEGLSMPGNNVTNTIAGLASQYQQMLDKQKKEQEAKAKTGTNQAQVTPSAVQPTKMENPYMTSMDWQNNVSRVNEIPLSGIVNSLRYLGR